MWWANQHARMLRCSHCDIMLAYWPVKGAAVGRYSQRVHPAEVDTALDGIHLTAKLFKAKLEQVRGRVKFQQRHAMAAAAPPPVPPTAAGAEPKAKYVPPTPKPKLPVPPKPSPPTAAMTTSTAASSQGPLRVPTVAPVAQAPPQAPSPEPDYHEVDPSANDFVQPASASAMQPTETIHRGMAQVVEGQYSDKETRMS